MLSAKEVCEQLKVPARTLAGWRKEGLPCVPEKGKLLYDPDALAGWLLATGKAKRQEDLPKTQIEAPVFSKIREVAEFFGVNSRTVKTWLEDPSFPGKPGKFTEGRNIQGCFPTRAIADWLQQPGRQTKVKVPESLRKPDAVAVTPTTRDQLVEVKTEQAKLELRKMQGKMIDAEEAQAFFTRVNASAVSVFGTLSHRLLAELPSNIDARSKSAIFKAAEKVAEDVRWVMAELIEGDRDKLFGGGDERLD